VKEKPGKPARYEPIRVTTHRELLKKRAAINERFNADPDLARLLMVNPIFAFEDAGVEMSQEIKDHITNRMRFPPKLVARIEQLEGELRADLDAIGIDAELPLSAEKRRHVLFDVLKVPPEIDERVKRRQLLRTTEFRERHPLATKLAEYERARQGALIFHRREIYEAHKSGQRRLGWLKSIRFKI